MTTTNKELPQQENDELLVLGDLWRLFITNWYWFAASVAMCLAAGIIYILVSTPVYTRSTSLLIKEQEKGSKAVNMAAGFEDLGLLRSQTNITNDMLTIKAPVMMEEVVRRLHLDLQLSTREGMHRHYFYDDAPVNISLSKAGNEQTLSFYAQLEAEKVILSDFAMLGEEIASTQIEARPGQAVQTPLGLVTVHKLANYNEYLGKSIRVQKNPVEETAAAFSAKLTLALSDKESTILNLTLADVNTARADAILYSLIDLYNENWVKDKNLIAESTSQFITERLTRIEKELGAVDENISEFKSQHLMPNVDRASELYMQQADRQSQQLLELYNRVAMARFIRQHLEKAGATDLLPINSGVDHAGLEKRIEMYNENVIQREELVANSSKQNPLVTDLDRTISAQRQSILHSVDNLIAQLNTEIATYQRSEDKAKQQIASNPKQAKQLLSVERQQKVKEALYLYLLQKREENELSKAYTAYNSRIVQPPSGKKAPTSPKKAIILLASLVLGLVIPGGVLFLRETLNTTVRGRTDLDGMPLPLVGEIPLDREEAKIKLLKKDRSIRNLVVEKNNSDQLNEAFRIVRTKLGYITGLKHHKVFMVTSFNPGSGKTFITTNLAASIALNGARIAILDTDLRRAALSRIIRSPRMGLSNYLANQTDDINSLLHPLPGTEGIDVIPAGNIPPNPAELLMSDRLKTLIETLRTRYDYIFMDCPPVELVADTGIVRDLADMTLFVVRVGLMDRRMLADIAEMYQKESYKEMALILNGTKYISSKYGHYRYGYNYNYGK